MGRPRTLALWLSTVVVLWLGATMASAPQAAGIAETVTDSSGAALPGVTVEAVSPALIEKVRAAVTDGQGVYRLVDLRPGRYVVTFSLPGFSTNRREDIELVAGFTATVNAEMRVGAVEETVVVAGANPLVDVSNVRAHTVVSNELLSTLPTGLKSLGTLLTLTPGLTGAADVGGTAGAYRGMGSPQSVTYHGMSGMKVTFDDMA